MKKVLLALALSGCSFGRAVVTKEPCPPEPYIVTDLIVGVLGVVAGLATINHAVFIGGTAALSSGVVYAHACN